MKLNKLTIKAFRGIGPSITFDFTSGLTVLYAPNGTGKTSVCDAVEWLFTGQIGRLGIGLSGDQDGLRCFFSPKDAQTEVQADVTAARSDHTLARNGSSAFIHLAGSWQKLDERSLLELLAPDLVEDNVFGTSANATRRGWLRGSRFLSGQSLSLLLDSSADSNESRQRVFADILGTRSLVDTSRKVARYCQKIKGEITVAQGQILALRQETQRLTAQLGIPDAGHTSSGVERELSVAMECLTELSKSLGDIHLSDIANNVPSHAIEATGSALAQASARLSQFSATIAAVEGRWPDRMTFEVRAKELLGKLESMRSQIEILQSQVTDGPTKLTAEEQQLAQLQAQISYWGTVSTQCKQAMENVMQLLQGYSSFNNDTDRSMAAIYASVPEYKLPADEIETRRKLSEQLANTYQTWSPLPEEQTRLSAKQAKLNSILASLGDQSQLNNQRDLLRTELFNKRQHYDAMSGAVEKLRQVIDSTLPSLPGQSHCPVCGTDFRTPMALAYALKETMALMPSTQVSLASELTNLEAQLQDIDASIQQGLALAQELDKTQRNLAERTDHQRKRAAELARLGLSWDSHLAATLKLLNTRLSLAGALQELLEAVKPLQLTDSSWQHGILAFQKLLSQQIEQMTAQLRQKLSECHIIFEDLKREYSKSTTTLAQTLMQKKRLERELAEVREEETSFKSQWESLVGTNSLWLDENLDRVKSAHGKRLAVTEQATVHLSTARRIREYEEGSRLIQNRRASLSALQDRLDKALAHFDLASNVQSLLEQKIKSHTREQIESLRSVVSPLFARMQSNRVFDRVLTGDNPLDWVGMVENTIFTPNMHFSQGQRQDLALAIFLARARGLGGTFFLDEPLAHLDDLNRLALLDALRAMVVEDGSNLNIVITTANRDLVKHLVQKFARVQLSSDTRPLRVYELTGNPRVGVQSIIRV